MKSTSTTRFLAVVVQSMTTIRLSGYRQHGMRFCDIKNTSKCQSHCPNNCILGVIRKDEMKNSEIIRLKKPIKWTLESIFLNVRQFS